MDLSFRENLITLPTGVEFTKTLPKSLGWQISPRPARPRHSFAGKGWTALNFAAPLEKKGPKAVIEATGGQVPVGYVTHLPQQDALYRQVFGEES